MAKFSDIYLYQEENDDSINVPLDEFTEGNLKFGLKSSMVATISVLGLSLPQNVAIKKEKISEILNKFNYWEDDFEHDVVFDL